MEKKIIITGTEKAINNIIQENRIREKRGEISIREFAEKACSGDKKPEKTIIKQSKAPKQK